MPLSIGGWLALGLLAGGTSSPAQSQRATQAGAIAGVVVDSRARAVSDARVQVVGTTNETRTDPVGQFRLERLSGPQVTIRVARIGFRPLTQDVRVGDSNVRLVLAEAAVELNAIVVTGTAGGVEKRTVGNTITTINTADLQKLARAPDITQLINGRAAGVTVIPGTGVVGAGPRIVIRGQKSLSLNDQPLLYVDGVRVDNEINSGPQSQGFGSGVISRLGDFNPDDIESMEIIKGPAAATLYGTEASNGVIQIITKKGKVGRPELTVSTRQGASWFMNPEGRIPHNFGRDANGQIIEVDFQQMEKDRGRPLWKTGHMQGYSLSLVGGTPLVRYNFSTIYDRDSGIEVTNKVRRFSGRANVSVVPTPSVSISSSLGIVQGTTHLADEFGTLFNTLYGFPSLLNTPTRGFFYEPPETVPRSLQQSQDVDRFTGSVQINHEPTRWLSQRLTVGLDQTNELNQQVRPKLSPEDAQFFGGVSALGFKNAEHRAVTYTTVDYGGTVKANVSRSLTSATSVGAQYYRKRTELVSARGERFPAPNLTTVTALAVTFGNEDLVENTTVGSYLQQQFGWQGRAFLTGAVRIDNNSAFGENFEFAAYPKLSGTWVISEEPFWHVGFARALKLRAAYGQSGLQPESFAALRTYQAVTVGGGEAAITPQFIGNPDLAPERSTEIEAGLEAGLFQDRIGVDFSVYHTKTKDAILLRSLAPSSGFLQPQFVNIGSLRNQGFELQLTASVLDQEKVKWDLAFNVSQNDNKILDLGALGPTIVVPSLVDAPGIVLHHQVGLPAGSWFGKKVVSATLDANGVAQNILCDGGRPDGRPSGVGVDCATAPQVYLGRSDPRRVGSVNSSVTLFGWLRLYGLLDFKLDVRHADNDTNIRCALFQVCEANFHPERFDPVKVAEWQTGGFIASTTVADAGFAKLREVSATVTLPGRWARAIGANGATVSFAGRNLHTWTNFTSLDPETVWIGASRFQFDKTTQAFTPQLASFQTTVSVTF